MLAVACLTWRERYPQQQAVQETVQVAEESARATTAKRAAELYREAARATAEVAKISEKAMAATAKATATAVEEIAAVIASGGWVALITMAIIGSLDQLIASYY